MSNMHIVNPTISIGMPVYNCGRTLAAAITSIINQTFEDWELLIIDDGSRDNTLEIAASFDDPRIIVTRGNENKRLPARLNECVGKARGQFFARMDGDDIAYPERLQCQIEFLQSHPEVDLSAGWVVLFRSDGTAFGAMRGSLTHEEIWARQWMGMLMPHSTWIGKIEWFRRNPYEIVDWSEDQDLLIRSYHGSRFATVPQTVMGYREDRRSLRYRLSVRRQVCKSIVHYHSQQRRYRYMALCFAGQAVKGVAETIAASAGLTSHILQPGATALSGDEIAKWRSVWDAVSRDPRKHQPWGHQVLTETGCTSITSMQ